MKKVFLLILFWMIVIFALLFSSSINGFCMGDKILNCLHLPTWSNGNINTHYTIFYSIAFLLVAFTLRIKYSAINIRTCIITSTSILLILLAMMIFK